MFWKFHYTIYIFIFQDYVILYIDSLTFLGNNNHYSLKSTCDKLIDLINSYYYDIITLSEIALLNVTLPATVNRNSRMSGIERKRDKNSLTLIKSSPNFTTGEFGNLLKGFIISDPLCTQYKLLITKKRSVVVS